MSTTDAPLTNIARRRAALWLALFAVPCSSPGAQETREVVECRGQPISTIVVEPRPPFAASGTTFVTRTAQVARRFHATSRPGLIRRYLALSEGQPCTEMRRAESERILRAQPFIADAAVIAYSDGPDSVSIQVNTVDELSPILNGSISGNAPHIRAVRIGNANLMGAGIYGTAHWRHGEGFRDQYGARVVHYQLLGRPYQLEMDFVRRNVGHDVRVEASHPYLTDLQRIAWRAHYGTREAYTEFRRGTDTSAWLGATQSFGDVGGVIRIGGPGLLALLGGSISHEHDTPRTSPVVLAEGTIRPDTSTVLMDRYPERRQTRANALLGVRNLRFIRVTGFETLDGVQDAAKGFQFSALIGRGIPQLDSRSDRGIFASTAVYAALGSPSRFVAADLMFEARRETEGRDWVGVMSSGQVIAYTKPIPRHTFITSAEWSSGRDARIPFQLSFADREGGLRGFRDSRIGGAHRLVLRLEDRYQLGRFRRYGTFGVAAFTDVGKLWSGDAPFGMNSRLSASLGASLLASIPPRSQRLIRLDLAYPLNPDGRRRAEFRLTARVSGRVSWREPRDVRNARERSVPTSVFNWP